MSEQKRHWNHRVLVHTNPAPFDDELTFKIHEVHYTDDVPHSYCANGAIASESTPQDLQVTLQYMAEALYKPVLWAADKFPQEYAPAVKQDMIKQLQKLVAAIEKAETIFECPKCKQQQEHRHPASGTLFCYACGELIDNIYKDDL